MRVSAQRVSQQSRVRLRVLETLKAQSAQRRLLRVADASFDLPFAIGIADPAWEGDHAVVGEHIAIERIQRRVDDVWGEDPFFQIVEDDDADGATQPAKGAFVELGPDLRTRAPHQQPHRLARAAQGQDEEARASVLPRTPVADHRTAVPVVDLAFFAGRGRDDDARFGGRRAAQFQDEAPDTRVPRGEAVVVDQVLPDRDRVTPVPQCRDNQLAIRLACTGTRRTRGGSPRRWTPPRKWLVFPAWSRWTPRRKWPVLPPVRLVARDRAPGSRRPANSREPSRGRHRSPPRSAAPASPGGRVQELVAASADPRRCSSGRGTMGPPPSSTSRSPSANGWFCGVD